MHNWMEITRDKLIGVGVFPRGAQDSKDSSADDVLRISEG